MTYIKRDLYCAKCDEEHEPCQEDDFKVMRKLLQQYPAFRRAFTEMVDSWAGLEHMPAKPGIDERITQFLQNVDPDSDVAKAGLEMFVIYKRYGVVAVRKAMRNIIDDN